MLKLSRRVVIASTLAIMATAGAINHAAAADPIKVWHHGGRGDGERGQRIGRAGGMVNGLADFPRGVRRHEKRDRMRQFKPWNYVFRVRIVRRCAQARQKHLDCTARVRREISPVQ